VEAFLAALKGGGARRREAGRRSRRAR